MKVNTGKKFSLSYQALQDCFFFLYMCTLTGHSLGQGFDSLISRCSFVLFVAGTLAGIIRRNLRLRKSRFFTAILIFWFYYIVSMLGNISIGIEYYQRCIQTVFAALFLAQNVRNRGDAEKYMKFMVISVLYMCIRLVMKTPMSAWGSERVGEVLNLNPNLVGLYTSCSVLICMMFAESKLYLGLAAVFSVIAMLSGSRKSVIILVIGVFCYFWLKDRGVKKIRNMLIGGSIIAVLFFLIFNVDYFYNVLGIRIDKALYGVFGTSIRGTVFKMDGSSKERAYLRQSAMQLFYNKPLFGYGSNMFKVKLSQVYKQRYSHCNYTELLANNGLVGALIYYIPYIVTLIKAIKYNRKNYDRLSAAILAIVLAVLCSDYFIVSYVIVFSQIFNGLMISASDILEETKEVTIA